MHCTGVVSTSAWTVKGQSTPIHIFALTNSTIYPSRLFGASCQVLEIPVIESPPSLSITLALSKVKNSTTMSFSRSHEAVTQDYHRASSRAVSFSNYFLSTEPHAGSVSKQLEQQGRDFVDRDAACEFIQCIFWGAFWGVSLSYVILDGRKTSLQLMSPRLGNPHHNNLNGEICIFICACALFKHVEKSQSLPF